jgi:hypothetical protein
MCYSGCRSFFEVRNAANARPLPKEQARYFHHAVAQLLFLSAQAWHIIQAAMAFLAIRVKSLDEDDWGKVSRC